MMTARTISTEKDTKANDCIGTASGIDKENTPLANNIPANRCDANDKDDESEHVVRKQTASIAVPTETCSSISPPILSRSRETLSKEISKQVLRHKLQKLRHLVLKGVISDEYLNREVVPKLLEEFDPQTVMYNGGIAKVKEWKISCYLEVMEGGIPCTNPHVGLLQVFRPLLETCDDLFLVWYKQQHACNRPSRFGKKSFNTNKPLKCQRLMTFVTRYTPAPGEQALLKHVDGAGKVDGSCVVALPGNSWHGHGGGLTFWDGKEPIPESDSDKDSKPNRLRPRFRPREIHYQTRSGDLAFIDRAVWHQADPITKGTRWALVIFYKVTEEEEEGNDKNSDGNTNESQTDSEDTKKPNSTNQ